MSERQRASLRVDGAAFLLFHPQDFPEAGASGLPAVPEHALVDGTVVGLGLGAGGLRTIEVVRGELDPSERADVDGPPWLFRLDVRHGALFAGDRLEGPAARDWEREPRLTIPRGRYRVEWFALSRSARERRSASWLVRLAPVATFDGIGAWLDPETGDLPSEDLPPMLRTPRLVQRTELTAAESRVRVALRSVTDVPPEGLRVRVVGAKTFELVGDRLRIGSSEAPPVDVPLPPEERLRAAVMLRRFAPWWLPALDPKAAPDAATVSLLVEADGGRVEVASASAAAARTYAFFDALASSAVRRADALVTFEALVRSGLADDVEITVTTAGRDTFTRVVRDLAPDRRSALGALLVDGRIWAAPTAPDMRAMRASVKVRFVFPNLGDGFFPLEFFGYDAPGESIAALRDLLRGA